ncbi:hypothetical protein GALMADRAFT_726592 [Galerina marginata CBS 339.88]|uniref:Uncharacterized protein n=1 Tax=Galerina marginata (strain CBS 339.88) TaxID=685588 RepID=A0A067SQS1_GALM3|nr:hypothetical protein GALMADRAFT_726592 [Galerina marginata CBS 339.88]
MDTHKVYTPLVQDDAQASRESLDAGIEGNAYKRTDSQEELLRPSAHEDDDQPSPSAWRKFSQYRLVLSVSPFTIILALGVIVLSVIIGSRVYRGDTEESEDGVGRLPCEYFL